MSLVTMAIQATQIEPGDGQQWYGYYTSKESLGEYGTGQGEDYSCAAFFSGTTGTASGKTLNAIRFVIQGTEGMANLRVWYSTSLPKTDNDIDGEIINVDANQVEDGVPFDVALTTPYKITDKGVYVGYSFTAEDPFPVLVTTNTATMPESFYLKTSSTYTSWQDMSSYNSGNLAVQVLLDGEFHNTAAKACDFDDAVTTLGQQVTIPITIVNYGNEGMNNIDYILYNDGNASAEQHYDFHRTVTQVKDTAVMNLSIQAPSTATLSHKRLVITRVNGQTNEYSADESAGNGAVIAIEESYPHNVTMEEFTGTWCGWCPRGIVGIRQLKKDFGDRFIGISIHNNDPMEIEDYSFMQPDGYPSCNLDREYSGDPFFGLGYAGTGTERSYGIHDNVEYMMGKLTEADVKLNANWANEDSTNIKATATITLAYDCDDTPPYSLAFVLMADSLTGTSSRWAQNNDFAMTMAQGYANDPYLGYLTKLGQHVEGVKYNDVCIATAGIRNGIDGSVNGAFNKGEGKDYSYTFDISSNELVQNKKNLRVAALLLNTQTGKIVNSTEAKVGSDIISGIRNHTNINATESWYSLGGLRMAKPQRGLNIVRYPDGRSAKVVIK